MVDPNFEQLSLRRQASLLSLSRSGLYYEPARETPLNLEIMNEIDKIYTKQPFKGRRPIYKDLKDLGYMINIKRVDRLMSLMCLNAAVPGPHTSKSSTDHVKYPYLLKNLEISRPNQVWATDITYIPMSLGFMYLVVILDWFSRYIISWELSNTQDESFCVLALKKALKMAKPEIFNSDQGSQFTGNSFINILSNSEIAISMDGKGRFLDNIIVERFWRTLKYEEVYLNEYQNGHDAWKNIAKYINFYNKKREHSSIGGVTPFVAYSSWEN